MKSNLKKIPCTVGILTYNSEKNLIRALESVKNFQEIIISDGGSIDATLDIARKYSCQIIEQYAKRNPGPAPFHPIQDFAQERNQLLDAATEDWFLYIDSDEYISEGLNQEIQAVCQQQTTEFHAYKIPIGLQSPDASLTYKRLKVPKQIRFFSTKIEGEFKKPIHERFVFDIDRYQIGEFKECWYVPISKPDFKTYSQVVNYRLTKMIVANPPQSFWLYVKRGWIDTIKSTLSTLINWLVCWIKYSPRKAPPFYYYRNSVYSYWVVFKIINVQYFKNLFDVKE